MRNKLKALQLFLIKGKIIRKDIENHLCISKMGVSKIVKTLIDDGIVCETEVKDTKVVGKKAKYLQLNRDNFRKMLCIYFGADSISFAIGDIEENIKVLDKIDIDENTDILNVVVERVEKYISLYEIMIVSIGVNNFQGARIKRAIEERFKITCVVENGVNLIALSQIDEEKKECVIVVNVENGVEATIVHFDRNSNKKVFSTKEIGHIPFDYSEEAPVCLCGNKGCFETVMSDCQIENQINNKVEGKYTYEDIVKKANSDEDNFRVEVMKMIVPLSHIILWLDTLVNPAKIVITGKITLLDDFFWNELKKSLVSSTLKNNEINVDKAFYNGDLILKGALKYGIENLINTEYLKNMLG